MQIDSCFGVCDDPVEVTPGIHLANMRSVRALLLGLRIEGKHVISRRICGQLWIVLEGCHFDGRTRLPTAGEACTQQLRGIDGWIVNVWCVDREEMIEFWDELLEIAKGEEAAIQSP